jgi:hypothetical protein
MPVHVLGEPTTTGGATVAGASETAQFGHRPDFPCRQGLDHGRFRDAETAAHQSFRATVAGMLAVGVVHPSQVLLYPR